VRSGGAPRARLTAWLVATLAGTLRPAEREAVCGDIEERADSDLRAITDITGLVLRRQAALWWAWHPWVAVFTIVAPVGLALSALSAYWAGGTSIYAWLYLDNWTWGHLHSPGERRELAFVAVGLGLNALTIAVWAWTGGQALQVISPATRWLSVPLLCLVTFVGTGDLTLHAAAAANPAVFASTFDRVVAPCLYRTLLVVLPAWSGARQAQTAWSGHGLLVVAVVCALLTMRAFDRLAVASLAMPVLFPVRASAAWPYHMAGGALLGPTLCLVLAAAWRAVGHRPQAGPRC
jgi:hypothetical protein